MDFLITALRLMQQRCNTNFQAIAMPGGVFLLKKKRYYETGGARPEERMGERLTNP